MTGDSASTILDGLDDQQKKAVSDTEGPVLIVAGAGAGKTRVLTGRIAYCLEKGAEPERILALTFTKKAANEMKERIAAMVGAKKARRLYMGTFHSIFIRFLREYADKLGYPQSFTIYDTGDSTSAIKSCIKELGLDDKVYKPKDILSRISMAKNNLVTPEAYRTNSKAIENDTRSRKPRICDIYMMYAAKCKQAGVMDFDDILMNMNILLKNFPAVLEEISGHFDYILVDEYQDTNFAQYLILKKLATRHRNICVVGDDSQSIYAFRGAKIENMLSFRKDYPDCKIYRLEQNYRSTKNIVEAANSVIEKNESRIPKKCFSNGPEGDRIHLLKAYTEQEEASLLTSSITARMEEGGCRYQDFAILYRTNSQSRAIEEALRKRNLPYMIYSGHSFFDRAEVKDMMAYLKLAVNPKDDESFRRTVNTPSRGIGQSSIETLTGEAKEKGLSLYEACDESLLAGAGMKSAPIARLKGFKAMIEDIHRDIAITDAFAAAKSLSDKSGLYASFKADNSIEAKSRASNIEELLNSIKSFVEDRQNQYREEMMADSDIDDIDAISGAELPVVTLGDFLEDISLLSSVDVKDDEDSTNKISLMTVHSSKGLEFPYVYIAGMEENIFPSGGMYASPSDIEEERRLFYVALTRAKKAVDISFAATRMRNGKHEENNPSRFIHEIDRRYIANPLSDTDGSSSLRFGFSTPATSYKSVYNSTGIQTARTNAPQRLRPVASSSPKPTLATRTSAPTPLTPQGSGEPFIPMSIMDIREGQRVEHNKFGLGTVVQLSGKIPNLKAKINFDNFGEKLLLLNYAKLRLA